MKQGVLVVLGHKGSGKSQLTRCFLDAVPRSVCIDTMGEYGGVVIEDPYSLAAYLERNKHLERFRVSYRDVGQTGIPSELIFKMLQNIRNTWICLEEASKWGTANTMLDEVRWFLQYGRHAGISVLLVARRPQEIDRMGTAQADTVVSFVQQEPRDLEYIRNLGGADAERRIASLGQFEWDYVVDQHPEIRAILDSISEGGTDVRDTVDSGLDSGDVGGSRDGGGVGSGVVPETDGEGSSGAGVGAAGLRPVGVASPAGEGVGSGEAGNPGNADQQGGLEGSGGTNRRRRGRKTRG